MRPARLLRNFWRELHGVARGSTDEHAKFRERLVTLILLTLVIDLVGSGLMCWLEIKSFFQSFFWVTTQLLTVSSQMQIPGTTSGRVIDIFLEMWAITVVATVAASFAAFLQKK